MKPKYSLSLHVDEERGYAYAQIYLDKDEESFKVAAIAYSGDKDWVVVQKSGLVSEQVTTRNKITSTLLDKGINSNHVKHVLNTLKKYPGSDFGLALLLM